MPSWEAWVVLYLVVSFRGRKRKCFKYRVQNCLIKVENVFLRANICNQSKLL